MKQKTNAYELKIESNSWQHRKTQVKPDRPRIDQLDSRQTKSQQPIGNEAVEFHFPKANHAKSKPKYTAKRR